MKLNDLNKLLEGVEITEVRGQRNVRIAGVEMDSRKVEKGDLFVAVKGTQVDGHRFIDGAVKLGAKAIICESFPEEKTEGVTYIKVEDSVSALGAVAANYYGNPSSQLKLIGVTGTNGKTTIATLLYNLFEKLGFKAGLLSTVENKVGLKTYSASQTTPDILTMNLLLSEMVEEGCAFCVMEVSSHAIHQNRIAGLDFVGGIFTNLTAEHLDYHNSFKEYVYTKKKFFDLLKPEAFALTNADDKNGLVMLQNSKADQYTYALKRMADFKGLILRNSLQGLQMKINGLEAFFKLIGKFNAYNLLAVYGSAILLGFTEEEVLIAMSDLIPATGRFEIIYNEEEGVTAIVDYSHTADALENVLLTINELKKSNAKTITLTGAGGDRDKLKRPQMASVSVQYSDKVILTSDNPRSEDAGDIVKDMLEGVSNQERKKVLVVLDRAEAIRVALNLASKGDVVLISGKGHETFQEIKGKRYPFDDREILKNIWF